MKKIISLRTKIIIILIPLMLIGFSMLSILSYKVASTSLKQSNLEIMKEMCNTASSKTSDRINSELNSLEIIASNPEMWNNSVSKEEKIELLKPVAKILNDLSAKIDMLIDSDKDDIKSYITREHHYFCYQVGWIDDFSLDCLERRYEHYADEGGNSFIEGFMNELRALPKQSPQERKEYYRPLNY